MDKKTFLELLIEAKILTNVTAGDVPALAKWGLSITACGQTLIEGRRVELAVGVTSDFPRRLPLFFLLNKVDFGTLPHVEGGLICYAQDDALVLDIDNSLGILQAAFEMAAITLSEGITGKNEADLYKEYGSYWQRLKNSTLLFVDITVHDRVMPISFAKLKNKGPQFAFSENNRSLRTFERLFKNEQKSPTTYKGIFIPLRAGSKIWVPAEGEELTCLQLQELVWPNLTKENQERLRVMLEKTRLVDLLVFCLPQTDGYYTLFGVHLMGINHAKHPLLLEVPVKIVPLVVSRVDAEYLLTRGGTGRKFLEKRVLVVGGGAVGGYVCDALVKSAVINVDVVDKDILLPENCYRHICGFQYVTENKAKSLKMMLESLYPHAHVEAISLSIENALEQGKINLSVYDAIIVATGNATSNLHLNRIFRQAVPAIPVLYTWLDPFGIGGHCLVTNLTPKGCFQCLYENESLHNRASFADKKQTKSFVKTLAGCSSPYVPYAALDAMQTAELAVRSLLDVFTGKKVTNAIYSWKGNPDLFLEEGYQLAPRFAQTEEQRQQAKSLFVVPNCTVCGN